MRSVGQTGTCADAMGWLMLRGYEQIRFSRTSLRTHTAIFPSTPPKLGKIA